MSEGERPGSANASARQQRMELARQQYAERRRQSIQNMGMVMANELTTKPLDSKDEPDISLSRSSSSVSTAPTALQRPTFSASGESEASSSKAKLGITTTFSEVEEIEDLETVNGKDEWKPPGPSTPERSAKVHMIGSEEDADKDKDKDSPRARVSSTPSRTDSSSAVANTPRKISEPDPNRISEIEKMMRAQGIESTYVPKDTKPPPLVLDLSDIRTFLSKPAPKGGMVQCKIVREKVGVEKIYPRYNLFLEKQEVFFMSARKRKKSKSSNYLLSLDAEDMSRDSGNYMGKLRSNFMGTEFVLYDKGENPKKVKEIDTPTVGARQELGFMLYETNFLGMKGPRKMTVVVPAVREDGTRATWKPSSSSDSMIDHYRKKDYRDMIILHNKTPTWHEESQSFVLNFRGRVTVASVKNFQLVAHGKEDVVLLQFGRVGEDHFTLDFQYPLSATQAFGIALSSFDGKLACE
eukprot:TRINITY_DN2875_c0_g2_i1.p1 TRINITY_DN2875_c0_g2~~TRINITY_DN2875_c0_g2_i1.p1  ORF type:complete len:467 (+),score=124.74 TRINITY_DN2875_c0_g2_i1:90-1490(+)